MDNIFEYIKIKLPRKSVELKKKATEFKKIYNEIGQRLDKKKKKEYGYEKIEKEIDFIIKSLEIGYGQMRINKPIQEINKGRVNYKKYTTDIEKPHSLNENFTHVRPYGFKLQKKFYKTLTWKELFIKSCEILYSRNPKKFALFKEKSKLNGKTKLYFSAIEQNLNKPHKIAEDEYITTELSAEQIRNLIIKMLWEYKISTKSYIVYYKADYKELHFL